MNNQWYLNQHPDNDCACQELSHFAKYGSGFATIWGQGAEHANLLLAAPDLLEALKNIANETRNIGSAHIIARAAIAKATGESA